MSKKDKVVLFGASSIAELAIQRLDSRSYRISSIFDNDPTKHGKKIGNQCIQHPDSLLDIDFDFVIITSSFTVEIFRQLTDDYKIPQPFILVFNHLSYQLETWVPPQSSDTAIHNEQLKKIIDSLPEIQRISLECGDADPYGIRYHISSWLGMESTPRTNLNWMHGWRFYPLLDPKLLPISAKREGINLTNQEEEAKFLREKGFSSSYAAGSPFLYAKPNKSIQRIPNSALIVSAHSTMENPRDIDHYHFVQKNESLLRSFDTLASCMGGYDAMKTWKSKADDSKFSIPWITGAWFTDRNALQRIWCLFSSFETLITNHIGSHIPYALACGCKLIFVKPMYKLDRANILAKEKIYRENPHFLDHTEPYTKLEKFKESFPEIFHGGNNEQQRRIVGEALLGSDNVRTQLEIKNFFDWETN